MSLHIAISFAVAMYERPKILLEALSLVLLPYALLFRPLNCRVIKLNSVQDSQFAQQNYKYKQATAKTQIRQIQPYMEDKNFHF